LLDFPGSIQIECPSWYALKCWELNEGKTMNYSLVAKDDCCISDQTLVVQATLVLCLE